MVEENDDHIDKTQWVDWTDKDTMLKPERVAKGDIVTGPPCSACSATGKEESSRVPCKECFGKGWVGSINASKVDLRHLRDAQAMVSNILNYLWEANVFDYEDYRNAQTFQIWREMHHTALGYRRAISSGDNETFGIRLRAHGYVLLLRRLSAQDQKALILAIDTQATTHHQAIALMQKKIYAGAISRLSIALSPIFARVLHLESLSEEERDDFSDTQLKNLLAQIKPHV